MASTALRRIHADIRELRAEKNPMIHAAPLPDNLFEWHFTIQGPPESDYAGGIYHGRLLLPAEWPVKPPKIIFMTVNGRFEVNTPVCLSISSFHPEEWQPSWGIRSILEAIITYFPTDSDGAVGSLSCSSEMRRHFAKESRKYVCPSCGAIINLVKPLTDEEIKSHYTSPTENGEGDKSSCCDNHDNHSNHDQQEEQEEQEEQKVVDVSAEQTTSMNAIDEPEDVHSEPTPVNEQPLESVDQTIPTIPAEHEEDSASTEVSETSPQSTPSSITKRVVISSRFIPGSQRIPVLPTQEPAEKVEPEGTKKPEEAQPMGGKRPTIIPFPASYEQMMERCMDPHPDMMFIQDRMRELLEKSKQEEGEIRDRNQHMPFVPIFLPVVVPVIEKEVPQDKVEKQKGKKGQICVTVVYALLIIAYYVFFYFWKF